jgi:hypothetical protein
MSITIPNAGAPIVLNNDLCLLPKHFENAAITSTSIHGDGAVYVPRGGPA